MVTPTQSIVFSDDNSWEKYHIKMIIAAHVCGARSQLLFGLKIGSPEQFYIHGVWIICGKRQGKIEQIRMPIYYTSNINA